MKKEQQVYIAVGLGIIFFIFVYFKFLLGPINKSITEKKKEIDKIKLTLAKAKKLTGEINFLRRKSKILKLEVSNLQKRLPGTKDIPDLLRRITRNAQRFGVKISNFQPQPAVSQTEYDELPFALAMKSNFHSLGNFFAEIVQEERLLAIRNLSLNVQSSEDKSISVGGTFTMIAYMAKGST